MSKTRRDSKGKGVDRSGRPADGAKTVTFSDDTKPPAPPATGADAEGDRAIEEKIDGAIGQLEVYQSGAVKMRLSNGLVLDVSFHVLFNSSVKSTTLIYRSTRRRNHLSCSMRCT